MTTLLCAVAAPSPPVCTVLQAERFPLSNPSLKSTVPGTVVGTGVGVGGMDVEHNVVPESPSGMGWPAVRMNCQS
jgi:hypothetical protein